MLGNNIHLSLTWIPVDILLKAVQVVLFHLKSLTIAKDHGYYLSLKSKKRRKVITLCF